MLPRNSRREALMTTRGVMRRKLTGVYLMKGGRSVRGGTTGLGMGLRNMRMVSSAASSGLRGCMGTFCRLEGTGKVALRGTRGVMESPLCFTAVVMGLSSTSNVMSNTIRAAKSLLEPNLRVVGATPKMSIMSDFFVVVMPKSDCNGSKVLLFSSYTIGPGPGSSRLTTVTVTATSATGRLYKVSPGITVLSFSAVKDTSRRLMAGIEATARGTGRLEPSLSVSKRLRLSTTVIRGITGRGTPGDGITKGTGILMFPSLRTKGVKCGLIREFTGTRTVKPIYRKFTGPVGSLSEKYDSRSVMGIITLATIRTRGVGWLVFCVGVSC